MSEVVVPEQPSLQEQPQEQPQETPKQELSPEDRMAIAAGLMPDPNAKPRDEKGRFTKQESQDAPQPEEAKAQEEVAEEIQWDQIKELKVKIPMKNGDKEWQEEKTFEELRNERMMHADYMARRREMDEKEQTYQKQVKESVEKERQQYLGTLQVLHQTVLKAADAELGNVDWQKLATEDPSTYVKLQARANQLASTMQQIEAEHRKVQEQSQKELEETQSKLLQESEVKLRDAIPNWGKETKEAIFKTGLEYGFKPEELGRVYDHRIVQVLHDAHQFRLMKNSKPTVEKKVAELPPVLRPKAQAPKVNQQVQQFQQARDRVRSDPNNIDAAADLMRAFIK